MAASNDLGVCGRVPGAGADAGAGAGGVVVETGVCSMGGAEGFPWNQSVFIPKAARTARATAASRPVTVLGKTRERGR